MDISNSIVISCSIKSNNCKLLLTDEWILIVLKVYNRHQGKIVMGKSGLDMKYVFLLAHAQLST